MRKLALWLILLGLLCPLRAVGLGEGSGANAATWITREGVVYQLFGDHYIPIHLLQGQEVLVIPRSVDGLPVHLEIPDSDDEILDPDALFAPNDARELRIEAAKVDLGWFLLDDWPNLERFSLTTPEWYISYLSISNCPRLVDFHTENQSREETGGVSLAYCPALPTLTLPRETEEIFSNLAGCDSLRSLTVPAGSFFYGDEFITADTPLEYISCFEEDPETADGVLYEGDILCLYPPHRQGERYALREGTAGIGWGAFENVLHLRTLVLPASFEEFPNYINGSTLTAIEVDEGNPWLQSVDGVVYSKDGATLLGYPGQREIEYETAPGTEDIGSAFWGNDRLETLRLGEGIVEVDDDSIPYMTALRELYLPASLHSFDPWAIRGCSALEAIHVHPDNPYFKSVDGVLFTTENELLAYPGGRGGHYDIPGDTAILNEDAFVGAGSLESFFVPAGIGDLEQLWLGECVSLRRVEVAADHPVYTSIDGVLFSRDGKRLLAFPPAHGDAYDVPAGTEVIGNAAFYGNETLRAIAFPRSLRVIEEYAFSECTALHSAVLPLGLEEIGDRAFDTCLSLEKMILPQNIAAIGKRILGNCPELRELQGPESVVAEVSAENDYLYRSASLPQYGFIRAGQGAPLLAEGREDAAVLESFPQAAGCRVLSIPGDYAQVEIGASRGYMELEALQLLPRRDWGDPATGSCKVIMDTPVYRAPFTTSEILSTLPPEMEVEILALEGLWCQVKAGEVAGYIEIRMLESLSLQKESRYYDDKTMVRSETPLGGAALREAPAQEDAGVIEELYTGTLVSVLSASETEAFVCTPSGQYGFMRLRDLLPTESFVP